MTGLRSIAVKFGAFVIVSALLLTLLLNTMINGLGDDSRDFEAQFADVSGLRVGDDVKVAGVRVGRVDSIEVEGEGARVGFELADRQPMLSTTSLVMRYQNLLGQRYLALVQDDRRGAELEAGARIPLEQTNPGFDLTELLNGFRPLFDVLEPDDVNQLASSMVQVLQGEGGTVERVLQETTELTNFVANRDALIGDVLSNLTPVLENLDGQGNELETTTQELRALMTGLARDRKSIGASIDSVGQLVGSTSGLLSNLRTPVVRAIKEFRVVADMLAGSRGRLNDSIRSFGTLFESLGRAGSYENALNVYLCSLGLQIGETTINPGATQGLNSEVCR